MSEGESKSSLNPLEDSIFQELADHLQEAIHLLDPHLETVYWNRAAEDITGYSRTEVLGRECHKNILLDLGEEGLHLCKDHCPVLQVFKDGQFREQEAYIQHKDGYRLPVQMRLMPVLGEGNVVTAVLESFQESFPKVALPLKHSDLQRMDLLDTLTGTGNRRFLEMHLHTRLEEMKSFGVAFGILYIDIDDLETINATYGTVVGDKVIRLISQTLASNIRFFEVVGRWQGQEFLAVLLNVDSTKLDLVGNKLRLLVEQSHLNEEDHFIKTTISAGATVARTSDSPESLVKRAKDLTAHSKWCGKNRVSLKLPEP